MAGSARVARRAGANPKETVVRAASRSRKCQDAPIHSEIQKNLILLRADESHKHAANRERQKQSADRPGGREQQAFRKQLANHSPTRGSERPADGDLPFASAGACEHQVRQVGASDEQDQAGDSQEQPQGRLGILAQFRKSRARGKRTEFVFEILLRAFGVVNGRNRFLQNGGSDREHLGVGARNGPSGFQAADGGEPPGMTAA